MQRKDSKELPSIEDAKEAGIKNQRKLQVGHTAPIASPMSLESARYDESQADKKIAPCFVKFYKYEEIKKKYKRQNAKDVLRSRLQDQMKEQK